VSVPWRVVALFAALLLAPACAPVRVPEPPPAAPEPPPPDPWAAVDGYALSAPREAAKSPEALAAYLKGAGASQEAVARALFRWVAANVAYDLGGARTGEVGDLSAEGVLASRRAVCEGYGSLFERLAKLAGLEAVTIHGYAKGTGYRAGATFAGPPNHAWNAVRLDGKWRLLDCTWGAGVLDESGAWVRSFEPFYFLTPPELFLFTHWPLEERWQLVEHPVSLEGFVALTWLKPAFFHAGLGLPEGGARRVGDEVVLTLDVPEGREIRVYLLREGEKVGEAVPLEAIPGRRVARVVLPGSASYALRVYANHAGVPGQLEWAADLAVPPRP